MAGAISGYNKIDIALAPTSVADATAVTSRYFPIRSYDKALFIVTAGTMSATGQIQMRLLQAQTSTAPGAAIAIGTYATMNLGVTGGVLVNSESATLIQVSSGSTALVDSTLIINEVTYTFTSTGVGATATATSDFAAARLIATSSVQTSVGFARTLHHLAAYVNHATYGVQDVTATVHAGTSTGITFTPTSPGEVTLDLTMGTISTDKPLYSNFMVGYMECHGAELATSSDYDHVAIELTPSTVAHLAVTLLRGSARYTNDNSQITGENIV